MTLDSLSKLLLAAGALWASLGLAAQVIASWPGLGKERAPAAGSALRGVLYSFTGAMMPWRKESVSRHPLSFAAGVVLHVAVLGSFILAAASAVAPGVRPTLARFVAPLACAGLVASAGLLARRLVRPELRALSLPDDYLASILIALLLAVTLLPAAGPGGAVTHRIVAAAVLVYLPLGKLRHAVFFFLARGDLGRRLGLRGVYPPPGTDAVRPEGR